MRTVQHPVIAAAVAVGVLALATACGGSTSTASSSEVASAAASSAAPTAEMTDSAEESAPAEDTSGGIPDPCTLLTVEEITAIVGADPGTATPNTVAPDVRKVCMFDSGLILATEVAEDWDMSVENILNESTGATTKELSGVGEKALFSDYGMSITQVVALEGDYFVGVTGALTEAQATALAEAMLAALS